MSPYLTNQECNILNIFIMDADPTLQVPLAAETPTEAKLTAQPTNSMITRSMSIIVSILFNLFLLSFLNAALLIKEKVNSRASSIYEPIFNFIFGLDVQIQQDLSIFVLGLILGLVVLTSTGHLTVKVIALMLIVTAFFFALPALYAAACELYVVMVLGPSKLRSEMLQILGYEFIGVFASVLYIVIAYACYKKVYDEGREVPWMVSAILSRTSKITNSSNFMSLMTKARYLPANILMTFYVCWIVNGVLPSILARFDIFPPFGGHRTVVYLTISCVIMISIILSIIARSNPSFSNFGAIYNRDMFLYMVNFSVLGAILTLIDLIGFLVQVYFGNNYFVGNSVAILLTIVMICACIYFKVTVTSVADCLNRYFSVSTVKDLTTDALVDTGCETQSTNGRDKAQMEVTNAHNESWGLTNSIATTGTVRDIASYRLLSDSESGELE